jgi:hypothetical protein
MKAEASSENLRHREPSALGADAVSRFLRSHTGVAKAIKCTKR